MEQYVTGGDTRQIVIQLKDGSTWTGEIGLDGRLRLLTKLKDPEFKDAEEQQEQQEQQQQLGDGQADQAEGQQDQQQQQAPEEAWGEAAPTQQYTDEEMEQFFEKMPHRGSSEKTERGKAPRLKLSKKMRENLKDPAFLARLSSVMLDNKYDRKLRGRTRGKLDMSRLYKAPTMARNLFTQKQRRRGKNYNIVLVVDQSGSMMGRPARIAAETVLFLAKQFEHLNLNIGVVGYGSHVKVHKEVSKKTFNYDELYSELVDDMGGTNDYPALLRGYHMLNTAPEGENILIQISDGSPGYYQATEMYDTRNKKEEKLMKKLQPTERMNFNSKEHLHHLVKNNRDVASFGIGIQEGGWQIPEHVIVHTVDEVKPQILKFLRQHIKRG